MDYDFGYNEILTQAQMPEEDDISEETKRRQQPSVTKAAGGRASGAKRARSPTKSSSSAAGAGDVDEDIDDDDEDFVTNKFVHAKQQKFAAHGGGGEKVNWGADDEMAPASDSAVKSSMKNQFVAAKGSGAAGAGAGAALNVRPALGYKGPAVGNKVAKKNKKWSDDEKETLLAAIRSHGVGNWQAMLDDPRFMSQLSGRTGVNLKDKYRTMQRGGEIG